MDSKSESKYFRAAEVLKRFALSGPQLHRMIARGIFPRPVYFGPRSPRWRSADLDAFEQLAMRGMVSSPAAAAALTCNARSEYQRRAGAGEILAKRRKTAAGKSEGSKSDQDG